MKTSVTFAAITTVLLLILSCSSVFSEELGGELKLNNEKEGPSLKATTDWIKSKLDNSEVSRKFEMGWNYVDDYKINIIFKECIVEYSQIEKTTETDPNRPSQLETEIDNRKYIFDMTRLKNLTGPGSAGSAAEPTIFVSLYGDGNYVIPFTKTTSTSMSDNRGQKTEKNKN